MADVFTPNPPPIPADCAPAAPAARSPSPTWLADYLGPPLQPAAPVQQIGLGSFWPIPPPGMTLRYRGWSSIDQLADATVTVPGDQIYHIHSIAVAFSGISGSGLFTMVVRVWPDINYDNFETMRFGDSVSLQAGDAGQYVFSQCPAVGNVDQRYAVGCLPNPFFVPPGWTILAGFALTTGGNWIDESRWALESWDLVPLGSSPGGGGGGATGGGATGGGYQWPGPFFQEG